MELEEGAVHHRPLCSQRSRLPGSRSLTSLQTPPVSRRSDPISPLPLARDVPLRFRQKKKTKQREHRATAAPRSRASPAAAGSRPAVPEAAGGSAEHLRGAGAERSPPPRLSLAADKRVAGRGEPGAPRSAASSSSSSPATSHAGSPAGAHRQRRVSPPPGRAHLSAASRCRRRRPPSLEETVPPTPQVCQEALRPRPSLPSPVPRDARPAACPLPGNA